MIILKLTVLTSTIKIKLSGNCGAFINDACIVKWQNLDLNKILLLITMK